MVDKAKKKKIEKFSEKPRYKFVVEYEKELDEAYSKNFKKCLYDIGSQITKMIIKDGK